MKNAHVSIQTIFSSKSLFTPFISAFVRFFSCMCQHVPFDISALWKHSTTGRALVRLVTGVVCEAHHPQLASRTLSSHCQKRVPLFRACSKANYWVLHYLIKLTDANRDTIVSVFNALRLTFLSACLFTNLNIVFTQNCPKKSIFEIKDVQLRDIYFYWCLPI